MAGWGRYPLLVAEAMKRQGRQVYCLGIVGHADPQLADVCDHFQWNGLARFGTAMRYFKRHGVTDAVMAGKIHKVVLFYPWSLVHLMPDLRTIRMFIPHFLTRRKDCKDDTLLGAVVAEFAAVGIRFAPATDFVPELLVGVGGNRNASPGKPVHQENMSSLRENGLSFIATTQLRSTGCLRRTSAFGSSARVTNIESQGSPSGCNIRFTCA